MTVYPFTHLHVHSYYSLLDGMSSIPGLVNKAMVSGMKAIALTDHGNMFGTKEFLDYIDKLNKGKEESEKFKPIVGVEAYCARRTRFDKSIREDGSGWHLVLLAKNKKGYQNLCKLVSASWVEGYYYRPRIDKELLKQYGEGLIVSSACLGGEIPRKIDNGEIDAALESIAWFKDVFGDDFYLEIQRHQTDKEGADTSTYEKQEIVYNQLVELAKQTQTKLIATNDVHFVEEEHAEGHDRLICLSTGKNLDDTNRLRYTKQEWLKTPEEMSAIFSDIPEALLNTQEIVDKVEFYNINSDPLMPEFPIPESFGTEKDYRNQYSEADLMAEFNVEDTSRYTKLGGYEKVIRIKFEADYLRYLTLGKAKNRYGNPIPEATLERIEFELETMKTMGFPGYFLIVQDFIQAAKDMGVAVGPGRGSAAGSAVAYCLGITDIDPLKYDLLFERFLNPDRISMPDIDIDFDDDGRKDVLRWVTDKYGKEKVAHIITYGTMATKSSIKDVARVQGLPLPEADRLTKLIPDKLPDAPNGKEVKVNIANSIKYVPDLLLARNSSDKNLSDTLKYAEMLEGTVRQVGVHACGIIIGADDLTNHVPLSTAKEKGSDEDVLVTQYEGSKVESIGLIKMDFLGLKTLSIIKEAISNVKKSRGIDIDISTIPIDDKLTYKLYSKGKTVGTFQFESPGMQKWLKDLKPSRFEDLIAMNALYRPGPMNYIPDFVNRKHGRTTIEYDFPEMEERLKETYGITVYQEQVMLLSRDLGGFTRGESDELRKAMGKKLPVEMAKLEAKFLKGASERGFGPLEKLQKIWGDWAEFAKYAFNKSHATCYSWVSYQTAYLKAHYPAEFMAANLTRNKDDIAEITKFMDECKSLGIVVKGPNVNGSDLTFTVDKEHNILFGLGGVKGVGAGAVEAIIQERTHNGPFTGIYDFVERVNLTACNKKNIEALCLSGAFDDFTEIKREDFFELNLTNEMFIDQLIRYGNNYQQDKQSMSLSLFGGMPAIEIAKPPIAKAPIWSNLYRLNKEKELVGIYLSSHPLDDFYVVLNYICNTSLKVFHEKGEELNDKSIILGGIVTAVRNGIDKNGQPFAIAKLEDYSGSTELALFRDQYLDFGKYMQENMYLLIYGGMVKPSYRNDYSFKIHSIKSLHSIKDSLVEKIKIQLPLEQLNDVLVSELSALLKTKTGKTSLYFQVFNDETKQQVSLLASSKVFVDKDLLLYLQQNQLDFTINN